MLAVVNKTNLKQIFYSIVNEKELSFVVDYSNYVENLEQGLELIKKKIKEDISSVILKKFIQINIQTSDSLITIKAWNKEGFYQFPENFVISKENLSYQISTTEENFISDILNYLN